MIEIWNTCCHPFIGKAHPLCLGISYFVLPQNFLGPAGIPWSQWYGHTISFPSYNRWISWWIALGCFFHKLSCTYQDFQTIRLGFGVNQDIFSPSFEFVLHFVKAFRYMRVKSTLRHFSGRVRPLSSSMLRKALLLRMHHRRPVRAEYVKKSCKSLMTGSIYFLQNQSILLWG